MCFRRGGEGKGGARVALWDECSCDRQPPNIRLFYKQTIREREITFGVFIRKNLTQHNKADEHEIQQLNDSFPLRAMFENSRKMFKKKLMKQKKLKEKSSSEKVTKFSEKSTRK